MMQYIIKSKSIGIFMLQGSFTYMVVMDHIIPEAFAFPLCLLPLGLWSIGWQSWEFQRQLG